MLIYYYLFLLILIRSRDVVKNDVVEKDVYNAKIKNTEDKILGITNLAANTINTKINEVKNEIPNIANLATIAALNAKINKVKNEMPSITNLAIALIAVENKILYHSKYITTPELNKLTAENFAATLAQANLGTKSHIANFLKKTDFDKKLKKNDKKLLQVK